MPDRTPQKLRDAARMSRNGAMAAFVIALALLAVPIAMGTSVLSTLPAALVMGVAGGFLLHASFGYARRAAGLIAAPVADE